MSTLIGTFDGINDEMDVDYFGGLFRRAFRLLFP